MKSSKQLVFLCISVGVLTIALTLVGLVSTAWINREVLLIYQKESFNLYKSLSELSGGLGLGVFFLLLGNIISNLDQEVDSFFSSQSLLNLSCFFLCLKALFSFFELSKNTIILLKTINGDLLFSAQVLLLQSLDLFEKSVPLILALAMYLIYKKYNALTLFEKEVI